MKWFEKEFALWPSDKDRVIEYVNELLEAYKELERMVTTMGELINLGGQKQQPRVVCPHCEEVIAIDIKPFATDVSKILRDNCPKCRGEIFVGVLILCHQSLNGMLASLQTVIQAVDPKHKLLL